MPPKVSLGDGPYPDDSRASIVPFVAATARRILDVGCWKGAFGAGLKHLRPGTVVVGIEADAAAAGVAATRLDDVVVGRFPECCHALDGSFDCVVFNDVLEHLVDPWGALRIARSLVADGGRVVACIPNIRHVRAVVPLVLRGRWDYAESGLLDRTHLRFFTKASMIELFESTGYAIESITPQDLSEVGLRGLALRLAFAPFGREHSEGLRARHYTIVAAVESEAPGHAPEPDAPGRQGKG